DESAARSEEPSSTANSPPSESRLNSNSLLLLPSSVGEESPSDKLNSNSLLESAAFLEVAGFGVSPASRLSSNSTSSLPFCSSEMPLSAGSCKLMPLAPLAPDNSPRPTSSSPCTTDNSSLSKTGEESSIGFSSKSLLLSVSSSAFSAAGEGGGFSMLMSFSDSSKGELVG